ncbi:MAG: FG-GAP repeat protein, partial [Thermoplasmata archaeon]|nr:FG-GAP repeat protein [Thermoplasmata archaeon]
MKNRFSTFLIIILMICTCFYSIGSSLGNYARVQPASALDELETGQGATSQAFFGWNVSSAGDVNNDGYDDIIVGAPGDDSNGMETGAAYVYYGSISPDVYGVDSSNADIILTGIIPGDKFGWDVAGAGDFNNDEYDDIIVGAPGYGNNNGRAYIFFGGTLNNGTAGLADVELNGTIQGELFGHSVAAAGNVNADNFDDVIVGGPLGDRAYIFYGQTDVQTRYPNLYDTDGDTLTPETDFTSGINTTGNTPGYSGMDDGWDWYQGATGPYGGDTSAVAYNVDPNRDNHPADSTVDTDQELIIGIGDNFGDGAHGGSVESAAYGVQLQLKSEHMAIINNGGSATISFDWYFDDSGTGTWQGLDWDEEVWIKCRFGDATLNYLGSDLDAGDNHADTTPEVGWLNNPYDLSWRAFSYDITSYISGVGAYYLEFGGKIRTWSTGGGSTEDGIFHFDNILLRISNQRQATILEGSQGTAFGSCVTGLGSFDGTATAYSDVAVGAPLSYKGHTHIYFGRSSFPKYIPIWNTDLDFTGIQDGELFGWSISGAGDINNDDYNDLIIGAPGVDRVYIHFGKATHTLPTPILPNLWDDNISTPGIVDFDLPGDEVNSIANTFGLAGPPSAGDDDGWDWEIGTYGQNLKGGPVRAHHYDPEPVTEGTTYDGSKRLEVQVGPTHAGGDGSQNEIIDSGAWGVQINITAVMYSALVNGGEAYLGFNWEAEDTENPGSGTEERSYVKARFGTPSGYNYLGTDLGGDSEPDLFYYRYTGGGTSNTPWGPYRGYFQTRITNFITQSDYYYLDFGAKFDASAGGSNQGPNEGMRAYFDNIAMVIYPRITHDIIINGTPGDKFGFSVSNYGSLNNDNYDDIIIGAPANDTANGLNSGAMYIFLGTSTFQPVLDPGLDADHINYGGSTDEYFGRAVACAGSVDADSYNEVLAGAPYYDGQLPADNFGKVYVLSLMKKPKITLNYPTGGEILSGEIELNATATDSDNNIDAEGVRFYISTDSKNWNLLGNDPTPAVGKFYSYPLDTLELDDGYYYIKADVTDSDLNNRQAISGMFTVNNKYPPELQILYPDQDDYVAGQITIEATGYDSPKDLIGGGINETIGVQFYLSNDNSTWQYLGNDNSTPKPDNKYQIGLDTTTMIDGQYWLKANITDLDKTTVKALVSFWIDNPSRAPVLDLLYPTNVTELAGLISINATAFDMDDDINSSGVS